MVFLILYFALRSLLLGACVRMVHYLQFEYTSGSLVSSMIPQIPASMHTASTTLARVVLVLLVVVFINRLPT